MFQASTKVGLSCFFGCLFIQKFNPEVYHILHEQNYSIFYLDILVIFIQLP